MRPGLLDRKRLTMGVVIAKPWSFIVRNIDDGVSYVFTTLGSAHGKGHRRDLFSNTQPIAGTPAENLLNEIDHRSQEVLKTQHF